MAEQLFYRLYCDYCGFNKVIDGTKECKDLREYKRSPIQRTIPQYDPLTKKMVAKDPIQLPKQYKCPGCGRLVRPRKMAGIIKTNNESKSERWAEDNANPNQSQGSQTGPSGPEISGNPDARASEGHPEI